MSPTIGFIPRDRRDVLGVGGKRRVEGSMRRVELEADEVGGREGPDGHDGV